MSPSIELLKPLLTNEVLSLARERITTRKNFFNARELDVKAPRETVKLALLAVLSMNPWETLSAEEEALLRGVSSRTLASMRQNNETRW